jgi:DNA-directed RNA polymerase subunit RPC12/RpoP
MGKTTVMENFILSDIIAGHGCCYIDPHGDVAEKLADFIPSNRLNDVVYFNPADYEYPIGFNILEVDNEAQKPLVASGLMGVFKKIWPDVWSPRMEYILMNCVLALLDYPGATLMGINRLLVDKDYRTRVVAKIRDPIVKTFWVAEFTAWSEKYATEAIAPVQNKVGQFLSSSVIRNIVAQVKSTMNLRRIMDDGKILIVNLSKGRIGEDNMRLLGGMLITKLQLAAQERQNISEKERRDFYLYVDEFQNFANESFASILSEARKYRLCLTVAHQYIEQLDEQVAAAIFGNVGTLLVMRVGAKDAEFMETEFSPGITPEDLVNLPKFQMYLKLMVDGVATAPFSANTLPPISKRMDSTERVVKVSRERYAEPRQIIEEKVLKWAGMELSLPGQSPAPVVGEVTEPEGKAAEVMAETLAASVQYPTLKTLDEREAELARTAEEAAHTHTAQEYLTIKPERLAAIQASAPQGMGKKKEKPKFTYECARCGKKFDLAVELDTSRPIYCQECRAIILEERKNKGTQIQRVKKAPLPKEFATAVPPPARELSEEPNRPRLVKSDPSVTLPPASVRIVQESTPRESLMDEIERARGPVQTNKAELEKMAGDPSRRKRRRRGGNERGGRPEGLPSRPLPPRPQEPAFAAPTPAPAAPPTPPRVADIEILSMPTPAPAPSRPEKPSPEDDSSGGHRLQPGQRVTF